MKLCSIPTELKTPALVSLAFPAFRGPDGDSVHQCTNFRLPQKLRIQEAGIIKNPPANGWGNSTEFLEASGQQSQRYHKACWGFQVCKPWPRMPKEGYTCAFTRPALGPFRWWYSCLRSARASCWSFLGFLVLLLFY